MDEKDYREWLSGYTEFDSCVHAFANQRQFFRVNTLKTEQEKFEEKTKIKCKKSKYYSLAYEVEEEIQIGKTIDYYLGHIYPQTLPSILVSLVLNPKPTDRVLDVAASPGSKFSHLAMLMDNKGVLVGNDQKERISTLYATINRMNVLNSIVTIRDGAKLDWKERFDKVLLDTPCTALGSGPEAWRRWKVENSQKISAIQKKMLFSAYDALVPGGELVYSTCTYAKEENEEVVATLLENVPSAKIESIVLPVEIPHEQGIGELGEELKKCYRIYPQHLESEGFFIAKIRKNE